MSNSPNTAVSGSGAKIASLVSRSSSSAIASSNKSNNNNAAVARIRSTKSSSISQWKAPSHSCISGRSSLSSKSRGSQGSNSAKPHAYFASSEEESEAELDEKDSHSSRDRPHASGGGNNYGQSQLRSHKTVGKSNLRGSRKLAEIASKVGSSDHSHPAALHSSRVRMTIPAGHKERGSNSSTPDPIIASIYKSTSSSNRDSAGPVPPPPQTVTVAVPGKNSSLADGQGSTSILGSVPSPNSPSLHHDPLLLGQPSSAKGAMRRGTSSSAGPQLNRDPNVNSLPTLTLKRIRKKKRRSHKHLPRGLPVFKDPRSCMWTSTHDANAPSEDRYSSLVNVLLRPPKTPRKKKGGENENNNNGNGGNGSTNNKNGGSKGSKSGSSAEGSSDSQEDNPTNESPDGDKTEKVHNNNPNNNAAAETAAEDDEDNTSLIRLSLWSVIDGHGGGCVATYAGEVLLPHIAASVARALKSEIVDRGVCNVNGQLRDANALDLDGLIRSSDRSRHTGKSGVRQREAGIDVVNPNSIHYRSPYEEDSESEVETQDEPVLPPHSDGMRSESESEAESEAPISVASSLLPGTNPIKELESVSSVKTSVKTAVSPVTQHAPVGTHSPAEVASITRAITDSFLAVDEGWINSIDPVTTHQTSCVSNGRWNAGACALVVFIVQRLDWCRSSRVDQEPTRRDGGRGFADTSHNKDAARRRKLDYATKSKSVSSLSTLSSTSSITTEANTEENLAEDSQSEITETEDDDVSDIFGHRRRPYHHHHHLHDDEYDTEDPHHREGVFIATPAGCKCHYYQPHDAMLYTAHVGDCRAVMLGSAPPRTIKVPPGGGEKLNLQSTMEVESSEDESSAESIADEISSSEHDSDSSGDDDQ